MHIVVAANDSEFSHLPPPIYFFSRSPARGSVRFSGKSDFSFLLESGNRVSTESFLPSTHSTSPLFLTTSFEPRGSKDREKSDKKQREKSTVVSSKFAPILSLFYSTREYPLRYLSAT